MTRSLAMPLSTYSLLTSCNSEIICVRYSLLMNGLEIPTVNFFPAGAWVAASVAACVAGASVTAGACVAGACVATGACVAGVPHAASRDMMVMETSAIKTSFLLLLDMIFLLLGICVYSEVLTLNL